MNSGAKGKRGEAALVKILNKRFNKPFSRVVGSGNRWASANLSEEAKHVLTGDIVCPVDFKFCIECKNGYSQLDLCDAFLGKHKLLDLFLKQAEDDAARVNKKPLLCWKMNRGDWLVAFKGYDLQNDPLVSMCYREWVFISLTELLKLPDNYFFGE